MIVAGMVAKHAADLIPQIAVNPPSVLIVVGTLVPYLWLIPFRLITLSPPDYG